MSTRRSVASRVATETLVWLGFIAIAAFVLFPIFWGIRTSLAPDYDIGIIPSSLTLKNYTSVLSRPELYLYSRNSLIVSLMTIAIVVPISLIGAYSLARFQFRGKEFGFIFMIIPLLPAIAVLVPLVKYMNGVHLYNSLVAVILVNSVFNLPFAIWMLRNFIIANPISIEEAALIDGCSRTQTITKIMLPIAVPGLVTVMIYAFIYAWNEFLFALSFISSKNKMPLTIALYNFVGRWTTQWQYLTLAAFLAIIPVLVLFYLIEKRLVAGLAGGAVKG